MSGEEFDRKLAACDQLFGEGTRRTHSVRRLLHGIVRSRLPLSMLQRIMRHASTTTSDQYYLHVRSEAIAERMRELGKRNREPA